MKNAGNTLTKAKGVIFHRIASPESRRKNGKMFKELAKDLFDVMKNAFIVATVSAAYKATDNRYLFYLFVVLLMIFVMHIIGLVTERWSPVPSSMKQVNILYYVVIFIVAGSLAVGVMAFTKSIEEFVLSYSHGKNNAETKKSDAGLSPPKANE